MNAKGNAHKRKQGARTHQNGSQNPSIRTNSEVPRTFPGFDGPLVLANDQLGSSSSALQYPKPDRLREQRIGRESQEGTFTFIGPLLLPDFKGNPSTEKARVHQELNVVWALWAPLGYVGFRLRQES